MRILLPGNLTKKKLPLKKLRVRRTRLMGFLVYELNCHTNCLFFTLKMHKKKVTLTPFKLYLLTSRPI
jgi:hypothetical protein